MQQLPSKASKSNISARRRIGVLSDKRVMGSTEQSRSPAAPEMAMPRTLRPQDPHEPCALQRIDGLAAEVSVFRLAAPT